MKVIEADVLVVGTGIAGMACALLLTAARHGERCDLLHQPRRQSGRSVLRSHLVRELGFWLRILPGNSVSQDLHDLGVKLGESSKLVHYGAPDARATLDVPILPG